MAVARAAGRVAPRRAPHFSLLSQSKVSKRKASRIRRPAMRARCVARFGRGAQKLGFASDICAPDPPGSALLASSLRREDGQNSQYQYNKDAPWRVLVGSGCWYSPPLCLCREAQRQADQETRMFERSEFARLPLAASIAGCPGYAGVTDTRVAFFCLLFLATQEK